MTIIRCIIIFFLKFKKRLKWQPYNDSYEKCQQFSIETSYYSNFLYFFKKSPAFLKNTIEFEEKAFVLSLKFRQIRT